MNRQNGIQGPRHLRLLLEMEIQVVDDLLRITVVDLFDPPAHVLRCETSDLLQRHPVAFDPGGPMDVGGIRVQNEIAIILFG